MKTSSCASVAVAILGLQFAVAYQKIRAAEPPSAPGESISKVADDGGLANADERIQVGEPLKLWFDKPAAHWERECLPIGKPDFGAYHIVSPVSKKVSVRVKGKTLAITSEASTPNPTKR